jgi:hypothetical protein
VECPSATKADLQWPERPNAVELGPDLLTAYRLLDVSGVWFEKLAGELVTVLGAIGGVSSFAFSSSGQRARHRPYTDGEGWVLDGGGGVFPPASANSASAVSR